MNRIALLVVIVLIPWSSLFAAEPPALSPELAVLNRRLGTWDNVNTIKPGPWVPNGYKGQAVETIRWILDHKFIEGHARDAASGALNTHLMGYDPVSRSYRFWYFDSNGNFPRATEKGQWDAASQTLSFSSTLPDGTAVKSHLTFVDDNHINWGATWTSKEGMVMLDMDATQTRRPEGVVKPDAPVTPSKDAAPDPKAPPELKGLAGFVGDWNAEIRDNTAAQPTWNKADTNHKTWSLAGRVIRDEVRNEQGELRLVGLWTYDAEARMHREWYFFPDGNVMEAAATWDEPTTTLALDGKMMLGGMLRGPRRLTGINAFTWDGIIRDEAGAIVANLSGRQQRVAH